LKKYLLLILLIGFAYGEKFDLRIVENDSNKVITLEKNIFNKHNISFGMFDDRTGLSLIGYTYNLKETIKNEYFIGAGTMFLAFTGTVGWKHYYRKSKLSISSVVSGQYIAHLGFMGFMSTISTSIEYNLGKWAKIKLGGLGLIGLADESIDIGAFPFLGLNFNF
jgi:hypothetical protein